MISGILFLGGKLVSGYLIWWYGEGMVSAWRVMAALIYRLADFFSLPTLVRTWFAPWKDDVLVARNVSLGDTWKIWQQNFASRIVGFIVRSIIILASLVCVSLVTIVGSLALGMWLVVPFLPFILPLTSLWILNR